MSDVAKTIWLSLFVVFAIAIAREAWGQEEHPGHRENHGWYEQLHSKQGYSCCNDRDCRPAAVWRDEKGVVRARLNGQTVIVPHEAVLDDKLNQSPLTGHLCEHANYIYCALVGGSGG